MLNATFTSIRDVQRNYKKISKEVNKTNMGTVVMSNNQPQFVIVSLAMFNQIQQTLPKNTTKALLKVVNEVEKLDIKAPKDLSQNLNKYAWD